MASYDPLRDYDRQPSWSPITPTSPTGQTGFLDKDAFEVDASVGNELGQEKPATTNISNLNTFDGSSEQIDPRTDTGIALPDHEINHIWQQVKKALRLELKDEVISELKYQLRQEVKAELKKEMQDQLKQPKPAHCKSEIPPIVKTESGGGKIEQHTKTEIFDPFAPVVLGPIVPGFEDGDAKAIAELDEAMKEVDEMMGRMDEEMEGGVMGKGVGE